MLSQRYLEELLERSEQAARDVDRLSDIDPHDNALRGLFNAIPASLILWVAFAVLAWLIVFSSVWDR